MPESATDTAIAHRDVEVNGIRLHCAVAGEGPLVLLLHGFPDFWYGWRHQLPALAAAGFRAVAPDMRGCGRSERPRRTAEYGPRVLAADVAGLVHAFGAESAAVTGHDWGAGAAWYFAAAPLKSFALTRALPSWISWYAFWSRPPCETPPPSCRAGAGFSA